MEYLAIKTYTRTWLSFTIFMLQNSFLVSCESKGIPLAKHICAFCSNSRILVNFSLCVESVLVQYYHTIYNAKMKFLSFCSLEKPKDVVSGNKFTINKKQVSCEDLRLLKWMTALRLWNSNTPVVFFIVSYLSTSTRTILDSKYGRFVFRKLNGFTFGRIVA